MCACASIAEPRRTIDRQSINRQMEIRLYMERQPHTTAWQRNANPTLIACITERKLYGNFSMTPTVQYHFFSGSGKLYL